jgi:hypothetical protein
MERMEKEGIVGPANHAGKREIIIHIVATAGGVLYRAGDDGPELAAFGLPAPGWPLDEFIQYAGLFR